MAYVYEKTYTFLEYYGQEFGFDLSGTKQWLLTTADEITVEERYDKT